jgi:hypothetical protein
VISREPSEQKIPLIEDEDETLNIDMDEIVEILKSFHKKREERANN